MGAGDALTFWGLVVVVLPGVMTGEWAVWYPEKPVCAVRGSTVVISCEYYYPQSLRVETVMWCHHTCTHHSYVCHSNAVNLSAQYRGRAECLGDKVKIGKLRIKDVRDTDAGVYRFRFTTNDTAGKWSGLPGVTLKVDGDARTVDYPEKTLCAARGSTVVIKCRYDFPKSYRVDSMIWSHNTEDCAGKSHVYNSNNADISAQYADRAELPENKEKNCTLMIKNITEADAGVYRFSFTANGCLQCGQHGVALQVVAKDNSITVLVLVLGILLAVSAVIIFIIRRKRNLLSEEGRKGGEAQRRHPDADSDTYAALDVNDQSPDYDTLMMVKTAASDRHPAVPESAKDPVYRNMMGREKGQQGK